MAEKKRVRVSFYRGSHGFRDYTVSVSTPDGRFGSVGGGSTRAAARLFLRSNGFEIEGIDRILARAYQERYVFDQILTPNLSEEEMGEANKALWRYWTVRVSWLEFRKAVREHGQASEEAGKARKHLEFVKTLDRPY